MLALDAFISRPAKRGRYLTVSQTLRQTGLDAETISFLASKATTNAIALSDRQVKRTLLYHQVGAIVHDQWAVTRFQNLAERRALIKKLCRDFDKRGYSRAKRRETIKIYFAAERMEWAGWTRA